MENFDNFKISSIEREVEKINLSAADLKEIKDIFGAENVNENWKENRVEIKITDEMNLGIVSEKIEKFISEKINSKIEGLFWKEEKIDGEEFLTFKFNFDVYPVNDEEKVA